LTACANVTAESYAVGGRVGWVGTGIHRDGGWRCWSVAVPLVYDDENLAVGLEVATRFENETLNEHLVKTTRIE